MIIFEKICRACSSEGELQSLFIDHPLLISDMLTHVTNIQVIKDDNYPQNICTICLEKLKSAYYFIQQCQDVNTRLKEYVDTQLDCKLEIYEEITEINDETIEEYNEEFSSYINIDSKDFKPNISDNVEHNELISSNDFENIIKSVSSDNNLNCENNIKVIKCGICLKSIRENNLRRHLKTHIEEQSYVCSTCDNDFLDKFSLQEHMRKHIDHKPFKCTQCEKFFKERRSLLYHFKSKHEGILSTTEFKCNTSNNKLTKNRRKIVYRIIKCTLCLKIINANNFRRHLKTHTGEKPFICSICGKDFIQKVALQAHMRKHTGARPFNCFLCEQNIKQYPQLVNHINEKHADEIKSSPIGEFECDKCHGKFSSQIILVLHKLKHREITTEEYKYSHKEYKATVKSFLCNYCGRAFSSNLTLQDHIALHTGEKRYKCDTCEQCFRTYPSLYIHRKTHLNDKPFKCSYCDKSFMTKLKLKLHELTHTGDRPFKCKICNQNFRQPTHLKYHSYTHTGEKRYKCPYCGKSFALNGNLTVHKRMHTGETPYICPICDKGFHDSSSMKRHKKTHLIIDSNETEQLFS